MLLSPRLQKLHIDNLVVWHWMVFLKTRPFVKRNNAEFISVSTFTLFLMSTTHTLSCRLLPFPLPTTNNFVQVCVFWNHWRVSLVGHVKAYFSGNWRSSELDSLWFWTSDIQDPPTLCRKFLYFTLFLFSVLYTKNALKSTQFSRYSTTLFLTILQFFQNWVITEVLVCPVYILYEFILLDNSIRLLYFHVCFPVFHPFVYSYFVIDHAYHSHKSCPSTFAPLRHHSSGTLTSLFSSACLSPR